MMLFASSSVIVGDSSQLQNALLNLGLNARDAMPDGGEVVLRTDVATLSPGSATAFGPTLAAGTYLKVVVSDTGIGMDEETSRHAFEPFFLHQAEVQRDRARLRHGVRDRSAAQRVGRGSQRTR